MRKTKYKCSCWWNKLSNKIQGNLSNLKWLNLEIVFQLNFPLQKLKAQPTDESQADNLWLKIF